jgi:F0F1-type ATP synthase assembly protein I
MRPAHVTAGEVKTDRKEDPRKGLSALRKAWYSTSVGIEIAGCIIVGLLLGRLADNRLDTYPVFMLVGFAAGITAAGRALWRVVKREIGNGGSGDGNDK